MIPDALVIIFNIVFISTILYCVWINNQNILYGIIISTLIFITSFIWLNAAYKEREKQAISIELKVHEVNDNGKKVKGVFYNEKFYSTNTNKKSIIVVQYPKSCRGILFSNSIKIGAN